MDLLSIAQQLERTPLADTADGSSSWFNALHEEGLVLNRFGEVVHHAVAGVDDALRLSYPSEATSAALDGGLVMHTHPAPGTSFSLPDLAAPLCASHSKRGMVVVATTSHPIRGTNRWVRYILDTRFRPVLPVRLHVGVLADLWDVHFHKAMLNLSRADEGILSDEELWAMHIHAAVSRVCRAVEVEYRREVLL